MIFSSTFRRQSGVRMANALVRKSPNEFTRVPGESCSLLSQN